MNVYSIFYRYIDPKIIWRPGHKETPVKKYHVYYDLQCCPFDVKNPVHPLQKC